MNKNNAMGRKRNYQTVMSTDIKMSLLELMAYFIFLTRNHSFARQNHGDERHIDESGEGLSLQNMGAFYLSKNPVISVRN